MSAQTKTNSQSLVSFSIPKKNWIFFHYAVVMKKCSKRSGSTQLFSSCRKSEWLIMKPLLLSQIDLMPFDSLPQFFLLADVCVNVIPNFVTRPVVPIDLEKFEKRKNVGGTNYLTKVDSRRDMSTKYDFYFKQPEEQNKLICKTWLLHKFMN